MLNAPDQKIPLWLTPLSGILLFASWPVSPFTFLIFIAWLPLLWIDLHTQRTNRFFWIAFLNLVIWNIATTWWIWFSTSVGAVGAIFANSIIMCFPVMTYRFVRRKTNLHFGLVSLVAFWITYEFIHHNWDLSWPWLTLGNVFATRPGWVQWYEFTGTTGGTLWVWIVNILLFYLLLQKHTGKLKTKSAIAATAIFLPLLISIGVTPKAADTSTSPNVVVVQPNVEPYTEKFTTPPELLVKDLMSQTTKSSDASTALVIWPETAIPGNLWENHMETAEILIPIRQWFENHPDNSLVTGIESLFFFGTEKPDRFSIRTMDDGNHYEAYNTALYIQDAKPLATYHKAKLVPGVETLPSWLAFMGGLFDDLGGITGSLGRSEGASVFSSAGNPYRSAPIICYESIYSDYVTEYVRNGANLLTVITNDGWWKETPGHRQHMHMSRLRAIENRRWVARSANTGISCFINEKGEVLKRLEWEAKGALKMNVPVLNEMTFYSRNGDWLSRAIWPLAILLFTLSFFHKRLFKNLKDQNNDVNIPI